MGLGWGLGCVGWVRGGFAWFRVSWVGFQGGFRVGSGLVEGGFKMCSELL